MILAAGKGKRLRPLTDSVPKALVEIEGIPLLGWVARDLLDAGVHRLIVNTHHLAAQIEAFISNQDGLGVPTVVSREDAVSSIPLETGGALVHAAPLFEAKAPFLLHNADVISDIQLGPIYQEHLAGEDRDGRIATLIATERTTTRPLLVDEDGVFGRANRVEGWQLIARHPAARGTREGGFTGIHIVSERIFNHLTEKGAFSLMDSYMRLIGEGEHIAVHDATGAAWYDIGTPERLEEAREGLAAKWSQ